MFIKEQKKRVSSEEIKDDTKIKARTSRSFDDVKTLFKENYIKKNKLDPNDEKIAALVNDLADREIANSKRLSKVLKQKIGYRTRLEEKSKKEDEDNEVDDKKSLDFTKFKEIERLKAANEVIKQIIKNHPDEGLSYDEVYEKIREVYTEKKTDTSREDFKKRIRSAFRNAYPSLYEEEIKRAERKKIAEEKGSSSYKEYKEKKVDPVRKNRPVKIIDWYK